MERTLAPNTKNPQTSHPVGENQISREGMLVNRRDTLIRWHIFLILAGLILGVLILFVIEVLFPAMLGSLAAQILVLGVGPLGTLLLGRWVTRGTQ